MHTVVTVDTPELGDRSYLAHDGEVAVVVDPQRDIDRVLSIADAAGVTITHVAETHLHNDYVSGGLQLARVTGAEYLVNGVEEVRFERTPIRDGENVPIGTMSLRAVATPGHTPGHLAFVLSDGAVPEEAVPGAVFTGGSLLYGTVGRTDLVDPALSDELARAQFRSVRALDSMLPPSVLVRPTHGFGSFCSTSPISTDVASGDLAAERVSNEALLEEDEDAFVTRLLQSFVDYPRYYARMGPTNAEGPAPIDLSPLPVVPAGELRKRIAAGEWVVDLRERRSYARNHLSGTVSFEQTTSLATYLGWVIPFEARITLIADSPARVARAQRDLARIGIDRPSGAAHGRLEQLAPGAPTSTYDVSDFLGLAKAVANGDPVILDVRRDDEWDTGHIEGAVHIFLADLADRIGEVPPGEVWVHCAGGYRASIGASIVNRAGRRTVLVHDDWVRAAACGLHIVRD
ncbi:MAG TPA: MBL fold metallo-hydrolase [Acidimicrobiales bacterium]|nr:MBL fold metallo-hydrolase [Acidimicrobiales bacterium]